MSKEMQVLWETVESTARSQEALRWYILGLATDSSQESVVGSPDISMQGAAQVTNTNMDVNNTGTDSVTRSSALPSEEGPMEDDGGVDEAMVMERDGTHSRSDHPSVQPPLDTVESVGQVSHCLSYKLHSSLIFLLPKPTWETQLREPSTSSEHDELPGDE